MATTSYDALAARLLLKGTMPGDKAFKKLLAHAKDKVECPECGSMGPHESNGAKYDETLCCDKCGNHFEKPSL